jgi:hypothetical protein
VAGSCYARDQGRTTLEEVVWLVEGVAATARRLRDEPD